MDPGRAAPAMTNDAAPARTKDTKGTKDTKDVNETIDKNHIETRTTNSRTWPHVVRVTFAASAVTTVLPAPLFFEGNPSLVGQSETEPHPPGPSLCVLCPLCVLRERSTIRTSTPPGPP